MKSVIGAAWPEWEAIKEIGSGSFGSVFLCTKTEHKLNVSAAIKVISIPKDQSEVDDMVSKGLSEESIRDHFRKVVEKCVDEINIMETVKGAPNIVHVEDFKVIEMKDAVRWFILIRMELLESLTGILRRRDLSREEISCLGIDICNALEVCHGNNIIHCDIKPANIMFSANSGFKLADFGISLRANDSGIDRAQCGTLLYIAPEIFSGARYNEQSDIYSLGILLYQLLNRNCPPFVDTSKIEITDEDKKYAIMCRRNAQPMQPPLDASPAMARVILKACEYLPENRFHSVSEMKAAIIDAMYADAQFAGSDSGYTQNNASNKGGKRTNIVLGIMATVLSVIVFVLLYLYFFQ